MALRAPPLHRGGNPELKFFSYHHEADTAHVVSELPTARKPRLYLLSRLRSNRHITCVQCKRATLPILNHMSQTFSLLPVFRPVLSKGASKVKIAWHLVAINFGYEYLCFVIYFSEIFFPKMFFSNFFLFQFFPQNFFFEIFSQNFFFQIFFFKFVPHNFFSNFFQKLFF